MHASATDVWWTDMEKLTFYTVYEIHIMIHMVLNSTQELCMFYSECLGIYEKMNFTGLREGVYNDIKLEVKLLVLSQLQCSL